MSTAAPTIPPRPTKASERAAEMGVERLPQIPPRPTAKRLDRSVSPGSYPRSPLNEPFKPLSKSQSIDAMAQPELPKRPSVQHLPSVGQEGMEYSDLQYAPQQPESALGAEAAAQTRNVAEDLHLHAPKPSLPKAAATAQVQAVTKTDSQQAAAHGIGKPDTPVHDDQPEHEASGRVRSRASFSRPNSSASGGRRSSVVYNDEQGPAELGIRVPINPLLGDVQAPSPAPFSPTHTGQNGEHQRRHNRRKSAQHGLPPGSYGLHGHGVPPTDSFERDWYARHPEELLQEEGHGHGVYEGIGSGRGAFALSSDDLNKIVRETASRGAGLGRSKPSLREV
jgi:Altered inheritance of mitochondria protein 21